MAATAVFKHILFSFFLSCAAFGLAVPAAAESQGVIATVNDVPITSRDVQQRINLWKLTGKPNLPGNERKVALEALIDDYAKIEQAKKLKILPSPADVEARLTDIAKNMKVDRKGLDAKLKSQGISLDVLSTYIKAQISFNRLARSKNLGDIQPTDAEVDQKMAEVKAEIDGKVRAYMADPRMKAVTIYELLQIDFPLDGPPDPSLMQARAAEVNQFVSRFKGCGSARSAASGIFNVKIGKTIQADGAKLPPQMKSVLDKVKAGRAIGPVKGPNGLQAIGFCGTKKLEPPKPKVEYPTREQIKGMLSNRKYDSLESKMAQEWRKSLMVEYRDQAPAE